MIIYYDTKTNNVFRFINQIKLICPKWTYININELEYFESTGHLITYTWANGTVPITTDYFISHFGSLIKSVSSSGNRNFGNQFGQSADIIADRLNCPMIHKFELSGFKNDVHFVINEILKLEKVI